MPKTEDGGFILDDSGMCPYSINEKPEKEKENKEEKANRGTDASGECKE